jgi:hypothetical protein
MTDRATIDKALRRLNRLHGRIIDRFNEARAAGTASPGFLLAQLVALMQLHADRHRLMLSYDADELAAIMARLGPPGSRLPMPQ